MTKELSPTEKAISRRHFLLSTGLATTALGLKPLTGMAAPTRQPPAPAVASGKLRLWSDRPALQVFDLVNLIHSEPKLLFY